MTKQLVLTVVLRVLLFTSHAYGYEGELCGVDRACSGYGEVCIASSYTAPGKCTRKDNDSDSQKQCTSDTQCYSGKKCVKDSKYSTYGLCSY